MNQWIYWAVTSAIGLMIGGLGYFLKRKMDEDVRRYAELEERFEQTAGRLEKRLEADMAQRDERITKLETRLQEFIETAPYKYTLRDDFIRSLSSLESKLNKIIDKLSGM